MTMVALGASPAGEVGSLKAGQVMWRFEWLLGRGSGD